MVRLARFRWTRGKEQAWTYCRLGLLSALVFSLLLTLQPATPTKAQYSVYCGLFNFPRGHWIITGDAYPGNGLTYPFNSLVAPWASSGEVSAHITIDLYDLGILLNEVVLEWSPGVVSNGLEFSVLQVMTYQGSYLVETRQFPYDGNRYITSHFFFTQPNITAIYIKLISVAHPLIPAYVVMKSICYSPSSLPHQNGQVDILTPVVYGPLPTYGGTGPTATNTLTPSMTTTPSVTPTGRPSSTYTPSLVPSNTVGPGTPTVTRSSTPVPSATVTPGGSVTAIPPINGGSFSNIPDPKLCDNPLSPCGVNPFMPDGVADYPTPKLDTVVPVTAIVSRPTSTLAFGVYCPTASSGPTSTPCPSQTPAPAGTSSDIEGAIVSYATNMYAANQAILTTPSLLGPDNTTLVDMSNGGNEIGSHIGDFFSLVRGFQAFFLGKTGTIVALLLLILIFTLIVNFVLFVIPIILKIFHMFVDIVTAALGIIP